MYTVGAGMPWRNAYSATLSPSDLALVGGAVRRAARAFARRVAQKSKIDRMRMIGTVLDAATADRRSTGHCEAVRAATSFWSKDKHMRAPHLCQMRIAY
jgi:hypothetical protein